MGLDPITPISSELCSTKDELKWLEREANFFAITPYLEVGGYFFSRVLLVGLEPTAFTV